MKYIASLDTNYQPDHLAALPIILSPNLRRITRRLNDRGFALRKRWAYIIEPMETRSTPRVLPR